MTQAIRDIEMRKTNASLDRKIVVLHRNSLKPGSDGFLGHRLAARQDQTQIAHGRC